MQDLKYGKCKEKDQIDDRIKRSNKKHNSLCARAGRK